MKREIKFRAWIQVGDKGQMFFPSRMHYHAEDSKYCKKGFSATDPATSFVSYNVMQFTGLKDKNGVEIYEGDAVQIYDLAGNKQDVWQVSFIAPYFAFEKRKGGLRIMHRMMFEAGVEVIGNIYENPELLESPVTESQELSAKKIRWRFNAREN